jgi:hypothetical protein
MRKKALKSKVIQSLEIQAGINNSNFGQKVNRKKTELSYTTPGDKSKIFLDEDMDIDTAVVTYAHELNNMIFAKTHEKNAKDVYIDKVIDCPEYARRTLVIETEGVIYQALLVIELTLNDYLKKTDPFFDTIIVLAYDYLDRKITRETLSEKVYALRNTFKIGKQNAQTHYEERCKEQR